MLNSISKIILSVIMTIGSFFLPPQAPVNYPIPVEKVTPISTPTPSPISQDTLSVPINGLCKRLYKETNLITTTQNKELYKDICGVKFGSTIPGVNAFFIDSLVASIATTDTSMTLVSGKDFQGNQLSGTYGFVLDEGTASEEVVQGSVTAGVVSSLTRGIDPITGTTTVAALQFAHRRGASVKITTYPILGILARIANGADGFPGAVHYDSEPAFTAGTQLVDKTYVDSGVLAGAATSTQTTTGISRLATKLQQASSTATTVNTPLVIQAQNATSTFNVGANGGNGLNVVVTQNNNTIDPNFIATSSSYTWTASTTFSGLVNFNNATSTHNATTSISAASSTAPLILNTVQYGFPSVQGGPKTSLYNDGLGNLTWAGYAGVIASSTTSVNQFSSTATTTLATFTIPRNVLGVGGILKMTIPITKLFITNAKVVTVCVTYNTSLICKSQTSQSAGVANDQGFFDITLMGNNATGSQFAQLGMYITQGQGGIAGDSLYSTTMGTLSTDSTADQTFTVAISFNNNSANDGITTQGYYAILNR